MIDISHECYDQLKFLQENSDNDDTCITFSGYEYEYEIKTRVGYLRIELNTTQPNYGKNQKNKNSREKFPSTIN